MGGLARAAGVSGGGVRWIGAPGEAAGTAEVTAWLVRWDDPRVDGWLAEVPPDPADLARFAGRADAGRRIARRRLARRLLGEVTDGPAMLGEGPFGAAVVVAPAGWSVSLAGGREWCAIAIGREPLGIDVEPVAGEPLPPDLLTAGERVWLAGLPTHERPAASLACWTGKEAHAKRLGRPRQEEPSGIEVLGGEARSASGRSRLEVRRGEGWVATVALG